MARIELRGALAIGVVVGAAELGLVLLAASDLFLTRAEILQFAAAALLLWPVSLLALDVCAVGAIRLSERFPVPERALARFAGVLAAAGGGVVLWMLTEGRRVRDTSWRPLAVIAGVGVFAAAAYSLVVWLRRREATSWSLPAGLALLSVLCIAADVFILPRLYLPFHAAATLGAGVFALAAGRLLPTFAEWSAGLFLRAVGTFVLLGAAALSVVAILQAPNTRFVVETRAALVGKVARVAGLWGADAVVEASTVLLEPRPTEPSVETRSGIDLRGRDILLITVDALRTDALGAYGSERGDTPAMDALATEGVVFERAYTPTPHTSYALTSLLTAKYLRPVLELPAVSADHPALPEMLRQYGYRTAAFYPPAIFFVDAQRFRALAQSGFGFEYRKTMFASAAARTAQLSRYLNEVEPGHPLFIWVHLFEPHEPYDPPTEFRDGEDAFDRYRGEVRAADAGVAGLIAAFRESRPDGTVILTADHGEEFGDHGGTHHGTTLFDEQVRVPLIWSSPGEVEPRRSNAPVELVDLGTTLLSALGIPRDARMRGDDLSVLLAGHEDSGPEHAFAEVDQSRMVVDRRYKTICPVQGPCRLFDLQEDPEERHDLQDVERRAGMRAVLSEFVASIPRIEALAMADDGAWPPILAQAALGDASVAPELIPLLADERDQVRQAAARSLGELEYAPARETLARLAERDEVASVRAEAGVAAVILGDEGARARVLDDARAADPTAPWARRAALALARRGAYVLTPLVSLLEDESATERDRRAAALALGDSGADEVASTLIAQLEDINLREATARALGRLGGRAAADALLGALEVERYPGARQIEAEALVGLGDRRVVPLIRRFLGVDRPLAEGVRLLQRMGALSPASSLGLQFDDPSVQRGEWLCDAAGCRPGADAAVAHSAASVRADVAVLAVDSVDDAILELNGVSIPVRGGARQVRVLLDSAESFRSALWTIRGDVRLVAIAFVDTQAEIPPPPPEPFEDEEAER